MISGEHRSFFCDWSVPSSDSYVLTDTNVLTCGMLSSIFCTDLLDNTTVYTRNLYSSRQARIDTPCPLGTNCNARHPGSRIDRRRVGIVFRLFASPRANPRAPLEIPDASETSGLVVFVHGITQNDTLLSGYFVSHRYRIYGL